MILRCKMQVNEVLHQKDDKGNTTQERVSLTAVYGPEGSANAEWSKWMSATFTIHINNPEAFGRLSAGHEFFVDFVPAVPAAPSTHPRDSMLPRIARPRGVSARRRRNSSRD